MTRVLYPGSFDPITKGHMNIIEQSCNLFDEVIVGILINPLKKNSFFTVEERYELINNLYRKNKSIEVISSDKPAVDVAEDYECFGIVRGLRNVTDFEYEIELSQINKDISDGKINTICLFAEPHLQNISSSIVKEVFALNKDISKYVDESVNEKMKIKRRNYYGSKNIR